jgi:rhamnogalacturonan endolyase
MKLFVHVLLLAASASGAGFVLVKGGSFETAGGTVRVDSFEMADAPVTNAEYAAFIKASGHRAPSYFIHGGPPPGIKQLPVVYVNRYDAAAYCEWLSRSTGRIHRLPSPSEFEYAQRAGQSHPKYPWGDSAPEGRANCNGGEARTYPDWRAFLRPVRSYPPNAWGLYDLAGNVWQLLDTDPDPAESGYTFRSLSAEDQGRAMAGGSWARGEPYLRVGVRASASPGVLHPDIGFRVVREPESATHFHRTPRRLIGLPAGEKRVFLSWQSLPGDNGVHGFHVYRSLRRDAAGDRITAEPITDRTNHTDAAAPAGRKLFYRIRPVLEGGREGPPSEWAGVTPESSATSLVAMFDPVVKQGGMDVVFGDLDGDGRLDAVIRLDNGIEERARDPGLPVELEAFNSYGRSLWRRPLAWFDHCYGNAHNVPFVVYDVDGNGKAEVITRLQEGNDVYLAVLDGLSGEVLRKTPWTPMVSDLARTSTRLHLAIAYLDGKKPSIVTQTGLYENEVLEAFDGSLKRLWRFESFEETNGSGSHRIEVADVDGDGRDEIFDGTTLLNPDGKVRWSIYREHADVVSTKRILPGTAGRQVFFAVESSVNAGAYLVDAATGKQIWKVNREDDPRWEHAHIGWVADIFAGSPGMEMMTNRDGHDARDRVLFAADGKILMNPFPPGWRPINWTGSDIRDLISDDGTRLGRFTGNGVSVTRTIEHAEMKKGKCEMSGDLAGDYRDELVCMGTNAAGKPAIFIFTNTEQMAGKQVTRVASREYRMWLARNMGGGYGIHFEWEPGVP